MTNNGRNAVGRLNFASKTLDGAVVAASPSFDVLQHEKTVDRVSAVGGAARGLVASDSVLHYAALPDFVGPGSVTFEVTDGSGPDDPTGLKSTITLQTTVLPSDANHPPTFHRVQVVAGRRRVPAVVRLAGGARARALCGAPLVRRPTGPRASRA